MRSTSTVNELVIRQAVRYIICAHDAEPLTGNVSVFENSSSMYWWEIYRNRKVLAFLRALALVNLGVVVLDGLYVCEPTPSYPTSCAIREDPYETKIIEAVVLGLLTVGIGLPMKFQTFRSLRTPWNMFVWITLLISFLALFSHSILHMVGAADTSQADKAFWFIRAILRPIPLLHFMPTVRKNVFMMFAIVPRIVSVLTLLTFFIFLFAAFGRLFVLDPTISGTDYGIDGNGFGSFNESLATMFWYSLGQNGPQPGNLVGKPGFRDGDFWAYVWTVFIFLTILYIIPVITAVVFDEYSGMTDDGNEKDDTNRDVNLKCAFHILGNGQSIPVDVMLQVRERMLPFLALFQFKVADLSYPDELDASNFSKAALWVPGTEKPNFDVDSLKNEMEAEERNERCLQVILKSKRLAIFFRVLGVINFCIVITTAHPHLEQLTEDPNPTLFTNAVAILYIIIAIAYLGDFLAILVAFGPYKVMEQSDSSVRMRFMFTTLAITIVGIHALGGAAHLLSIYYNFHAFLLVHLIDTLSLVPSLNAILTIMGAVLPELFSVSVACFCIMYSWSVIGVLLLGGEFTVDNPTLSGQTIIINFNTVGTGLYALLACIYGNNIQQYALAFESVAGVAGVIFYTTFYLFSNLVVINILVSVLLDVQQAKADQFKQKQLMKKQAVVPQKAAH